MAAELAGIQTVGQCEWADYPTKVLEKHSPIYHVGDIRTLTGESFYERTGLRTVDIISGGFPCQPFSVTGKRRGKEDDRYLFARKCLESSESCTSSIRTMEKMLLESSEWHSMMCFMTWKVKVTPQGRLYYQLQVSEPCTGDIGQRLLPTLTASEWRGVAKNRYWGSHTYRSDKLASRFRMQSEDMTHINPDYAEAFMGFPTGWSVLEH